MKVTTSEDGRGSKARGSRVDYGPYGAVGVRLVGGNGSEGLEKVLAEA